MISRLLLPSIGVVLIVGAVTAEAAQPSIIQDVQSIHDDLADMCSGWPGDDPHSAEVCGVRLKAEKLLSKLGYCYGTKSDFGPNGRGRAGAIWHRCNSQSYYKP
jgi:hypothetical protein